MNPLDGKIGRKNLDALPALEKKLEKSEPPLRRVDNPLGVGLVHSKKGTSGADFTASVTSAKVQQQYARHQKGEVPMTAEAYAALTGIGVDEAEAQRLDALVKHVAQRIGLDHEVGFATETDYMSFFDYAFLGMFRGWDRPDRPIRVGVGLKANTADDLDLLAKHWYHGKGIPKELHLYLEDFLQLSEEQRIESILVHEKLELNAVDREIPSAHNSAVAESPHTDLQISPRTRQHLALYARLNRQLYGELP